MDLENLIKNKKAKVAVIGLGYVGLPTAVELAKAGYKVFGIDIKKERVNKVNNGKSYIFDVSSEDLKKVVLSKKLKAFNNHYPLKDADIVLICVPTPLDKYKIPDISYIKNSAEEIKKRLRKDQLIILESTTYPGMTEEILLPLLEERNLKIGRDFYLAFAPERIDPGNKMPPSEIPKIVGGITKECTKLATLFYNQFLKKVHPVSSAKTAEMTKILENTFRLVNISMINELSLLCGKMGINIWEVIEAAKTKPYGFMPFYPSPKVGGHCIPLDPFYLSFKAREYNFWARFIELAGEINEQMPHYVVTTVIYALNSQKKGVSGSRILVWGVSYKKDIGDSRESAAHEVISDLLKKGAKIDYFDPYVKKFRVNNKTIKSIRYSPFQVKNYDLVLILTNHSDSTHSIDSGQESLPQAGFNYNEIAKKAKLVVDTRNAIKSRKYKNVFHL